MTDKIWKDLEKLLEKEITPINYGLWVAPMKRVLFKDGIVTLQAPNEMMLRHFKVNYQHLTETLLSDLLGKKISIDLICDTGTETVINDPPFVKPQLAVQQPKEKKIHTGGLNRVALGEENSFSVAVCKQILRHPGKWNPLFLYGPSGIGKTWLAKALLEEFAVRGKNTRYLSSHDFYNKYYATVMSQEYKSFYGLFSDLDLLILDDVQFLQGKDKTQETFYNIFNQLYDSGAQIVLIGAQHPSSSSRFESALLSRFTWGLLVEMSTPGEELRGKIAEMKAKDLGLSLSEEMVNIIGAAPFCDMRHIEGLLKRIFTRSLIESREVVPRDIEVELSLLDINSPKPKPDIRSLQQLVADFYEITPEELTGNKRELKYARPRQVAMYLAKKHTDSSFPEISRSFRKKAHSTVVSAVGKVEKLRSKDIKTNQEIKKLEQLILKGIE